MSEANVAPSSTTRTDPRIGHVVEDQRSGDRRLVIYVDSRVVVTRDDGGNTTLAARNTFDASLGSRYRLRRDADHDIDAGQYGRLRELLGTYEAEEGRKAAHKATALREALDVLSAGETQATSTALEEASAMTVESDDSPEVPFEEVSGIGPETAGKLRTQGLITEADVRRASDEDILAVSGVGPSHVENLRSYLD